MCFGVHIKQDSFKIRQKYDPICFDMCVYGAKDNEVTDYYGNGEIESYHYGDGYNHLEILNWKKTKCYQCNRLYCAVIILSLLTNGKVFIKNLGHILEKLHRTSIGNGKGINEILSNSKLEYLKNFGDGSIFSTEESFFWSDGTIQQKKHRINGITNLIIYDRKLKFIENRI